MGDKLSRRFTCLVHLLPVVPLLTLSCAGAPKAVASGPARIPAPAHPTASAGPIDGFPLRFEGLSAQVGFPMTQACVLMSTAGDEHARCPQQMAVNPSEPPSTVWGAVDPPGPVVFHFRAAENSVALPEPPRPAYVDKVLAAIMRGLNAASAEHGVTSLRVAARERRATLPNGGDYALLVLEPSTPPPTALLAATSHQFMVVVPTRRRLFTLTWSTNAERADEIEAMARKTFESVRFEEP